MQGSKHIVGVHGGGSVNVNLPVTDGSGTHGGSSESLSSDTNSKSTFSRVR